MPEAVVAIRISAPENYVKPFFTKMTMQSEPEYFRAVPCQNLFQNTTSESLKA